MGFFALEAANFEDYRDFLRQRFALLKSERGLSLLACARKAQLSKSHLQFLLGKKRHVSLDKIPSLARALKISREDEAFVYLAVCKSSSRSLLVRQHFEAILARLRHQSIPVDAVPEMPTTDAVHAPMFRNSLAMAIHSLLRLKEFREDPEWILQTLRFPRLTRERVQSTLKDLEANGAAVRDTAGRLRPKEFVFWRPDPYDASKMDVYRHGALAVADLLETPELYKPAVYSLGSLSFDENRLRQAEKAVIDLHGELQRLARESDDPTATVFSGLFFLALSRTGKGGGSNL